MAGLVADIFVYGLIDPTTNEMRYVGKTRVGLAEPRGYVLKAQKLVCEGQDGKRHVFRWICHLIRSGLEPKITVIEYCDEQQLNEKEVGWISYFRELGCNLTNMTDGGEGGAGRIKTPEELEKISRAHKGRPHTERQIALHAASLRGRKMPQTSGENHWTAKQKRGPNKGRKFSNEHRRKLSESHMGQRAWNKGL